MSKFLKDPENIPDGIDRANWQWVEPAKDLKEDDDPQDLFEFCDHWTGICGNQVKLLELCSLVIFRSPSGKKHYLEGDDRIELAWALAEKYRTQKI